MTVATQLTKVKYSGDGVVRDWAVNFPVTAREDVKAIVTTALGVDTPLAYGTDYSFTPASAGNIGGTLTTVTAVASGSKLLIYLDTPMLQSTDYKNTGFLDLERLEYSLDKLTLIAQQLREIVDRSVKVGITSNSTPDQLINAITQAAAESAQNVVAMQSALGNLFRFPIPEFMTVSGQLDYTLPYAADPTSNNVFLSLGGLPQQPGVDFTLPNPTTLHFTSNPGAQKVWGMVTLSLSNPDISAEVGNVVNAGKSDIQNFLNTILAPSGVLGVVAGGTGANNASSARTNLGLGSVLTDLAGKANIDLGNVTGNAIGKYFYARDEKSPGTNGGTPAATAWQTRDINTVKVNAIPGASLASNRVTLPAGKYRISASAPACAVDYCKAAIFDVTHSTYLLYGASSYANHGATVQIRATVKGDITLTETTTIELRMWTSYNPAGTGLGYAASTIPGVNEVYSEVEIWKI